MWAPRRKRCDDCHAFRGNISISFCRPGMCVNRAVVTCKVDAALLHHRTRGRLPNPPKTTARAVVRVICTTQTWCSARTPTLSWLVPRRHGVPWRAAARVHVQQQVVQSY
eukprot:COSAG02_NODE_5588_length_4208_cov_464.272086_5_plen_110_part_00